MGKMKKLFGGLKMTWPRVLLLAVLSAVWTALMLYIRVLENTSFQDIGTYLEVWILLALIVILNCKSAKEAALKCFVFFLVSQPLIFLLQVPFSSFGWGIFMYYPRWLLITVLTLPGAAIAYLVKKQNWLSVLVLSVATAYLAVQAVYYLNMTVRHFPFHLLSCIFCVVLAVFLVLVLLEKKPHRLAACGVIAAALIISAALMFRPAAVFYELELGEGIWGGGAEDGTVAQVEIVDGAARVQGLKDGTTAAAFYNEAGDFKEYTIVVDGDSIAVTPKE